MSRNIRLAMAVTVALGATSAFATNGDNLIGLGAKSRAMGGTGIAHDSGSESANANPALMSKSKGSHITFGGTYFRPDVEVSAASGSYESDAKHNVIPFVTLTENLGNGFAIGTSMFGSAGMGTDWRDETALMAMRSNLLLLKFSVPVAYGQDNWSVGIAPVLMYGSLDMSFDNGTNNAGNGSSSSFGLGVELGAAYTLSDLGLTFGAKYQSAIEMEYTDQIATTAGAFGYNTAGQQYFTDKLEQPAEYALGVDWTEGDISFTADWKNIRWGNARGYSDFGWENQNVYAFGAEYRMDDLALRAGYNYGKNPISKAGTGDGGRMNTLNHVMFPAVTERHYTAGFGYAFTKQVAADFALTYATSPDVSIEGVPGLENATVSNDQIAFSANINYSF